MPKFEAKVMASWCKGKWTKSPAVELRGISIDTRTIQPGNVYLAVEGASHDGHDYVAQAFEKGAAAAVVAKGFAARNPEVGPLLAVDDTRKALVELARGHRATLQSRITAVTGSVGKTTVKEMMADVLKTSAPTYRSKGNWNNDIGLPLSILAMEPSDRFGVFELGMNHPGELDPLCALLRPDWGVMTAIGPVHIEFFKSVQAIAKEKSILFHHLPESGLAIVNRDEKWYELLRGAARCRVVTVSTNGHAADYKGWPIPGKTGRFIVEESASGERSEFEVPLPGEHVVCDALLAVAAGRQQGIGWDLIRRAVRQYVPPPMRWDVSDIGGITLVNDAYNANPLSMRAALKTFSRMPVKGLRWLVLGGMLELGRTERDEHLALGREIGGGSWAGLVAVGRLGGLIADGAESAGLPADKVLRCAAQDAAACALRKRVHPGDAVLLKASRGERLEEVLAKWKEGAKDEIQKNCCAML